MVAQPVCTCFCFNTLGKPFRVALSDTGHPFLNRLQAFNARACDSKRLILLDDSGVEIRERTETSKGFVNLVSMRYSFFNSGRSSLLVAGISLFLLSGLIQFLVGHRVLQGSFPKSLPADTPPKIRAAFVLFDLVLGPLVLWAFLLKQLGVTGTPPPGVRVKLQ